MNKYQISMEVPVMVTEVHEFVTKAESPEMAMLLAQSQILSEGTLFKTKADKSPVRGPYKINACRRLLEEIEDD